MTALTLFLQIEEHKIPMLAEKRDIRSAIAKNQNR